MKEESLQINTMDRYLFYLSRFMICFEQAISSASWSTPIYHGVMKGRLARVALFKWHVLSIPVTNKVIDLIVIATKPR